ncbi:glycerophosphodiester phosphodiesterase family protein [Pseudonocardia bannensis]|uniref:Glycerophosphodiester phosphodiesterase n=1 Tax=Pseudonocardia bannensis TaxID=630973 RepID=A0A848DE16_9PSEU|nr:glycerophosphodiester phosphodiesterase family protein [Pseudonocardia bannensis]NMH90834.1 glycerophosphodiester phosphodiesterase [Pseudonocardia bannensis]
MQPVHPYFDGPYPRAYAHRGWHIDELAGCENTLAAFRRAVDEGFSYLELDVHASADGVAMVHHDRTLDRATDGRGALARMPATEIERARVSGREPIPRLEQVLTELPDTRITIELKSDAVVLPTLAVLERTNAWDRVCIGGYNERWLRRARAGGGDRLLTSMAQTSAFGLRSRAWLEALPGPLGALSGLPVLPPVHGGLAQLPHHFGALRVVDSDLLRVAHASAREVHVWTVNDRAEMGQLLDLGADGLISDRPDLLRDLLHDRGEWAA